MGKTSAPAQQQVFVKVGYHLKAKNPAAAQDLNGVAPSNSGFQAVVPDASVIQRMANWILKREFALF